MPQSRRSPSEATCKRCRAESTRSRRSVESTCSGMSRSTSEGNTRSSRTSGSDCRKNTPRRLTPKDPVSPTVIQAPPGYSGFSPGVYSGNVFGHTYTRANKHAANDLNTYRRGEIPKFSPSPRKAEPGSGHPGYSYGAAIPGYAGFVAGVYAGNLISSCTPRAAKAEWNPLRDGPRPKLEHLHGKA